MIDAIGKLLLAGYFSFMPVLRSSPVAQLPDLGQDTDLIRDDGSFKISLNSLGALEEDSINGEGYQAVAGSRAVDIFTLRNFSGLGFHELTFQDIETLSGLDIGGTRLVDVPVIAKSTPLELAQAVPGLAQRPIDEVPTYVRLANSQGIPGSDNETVRDVAEQLEGTFAENAAAIPADIITDVPDLFELTEAGQLPHALDSSISEITGLGDVGIYDVTSITDFLLPFDVAFAGGQNFGSECEVGPDCRERGTLDNSASGNWQNFHMPCDGPDCSHIEVRRRGGILAQNNIRWFTNKQKWVSGGNGFLCGQEPVGRYPFGDRRIKVVVTDINEKEGRVKFGAYLYVDGPFGAQSANCFGPFPVPVFGSRKEGQLILFGLDRQSIGSAAAEQLKELAEEIQANQAEDLQSNQLLARGGGNNAAIPTPTDCDGKTYRNLFYPMPKNYRVNSRYGPRTLRGRTRFHYGVDIAAPRGVPIFAADCGKVVHADLFNGPGARGCLRGCGWGYTVLIRHANNTVTHYGHMCRGCMRVKVGDIVKRGQVIGGVGTTGFSTGFHLHFEVHVGGGRLPNGGLWGRRVDPCTRLKECRPSGQNPYR